MKHCVMLPMSAVFEGSYDAEAVAPAEIAMTPPGRAAKVPERPPGAGTEFPVVCIGASAGGLEACRELLDALPLATGMAFILVQHLDPTHESMMVDLLASHTGLVVHRATEGLPIEVEHLYIIPPGKFLSVDHGLQHLKEPPQRHGLRLPFDHLLRSLALEYHEHMVCIVLSGMGSDGSAGLVAVKQQGGWIVVQDPDSAAFDGMPRSAIASGLVDEVLPIDAIPAALVAHCRTLASQGADRHDWLPEIISLLRAQTSQNFELYKLGTLRRRMQRRMGMVGIEDADFGRYLALLRRDSSEVEALARDLLINVTSFFRDAAVFDALALSVLPDLVARHAPDQALRVWVAGCSTGEEAYSLAMLLREQIAAAKLTIRLQIFASDVDAEAIARAREGLYPGSIEAVVSPARLARFFTKEGANYRVSPDLRALIVFTVQDVLGDPPFARIDLISCRNLLIYLSPEAQARVAAVFLFGLREGGLLLLGAAEAIGGEPGQFEIVSKPLRLYRRVGRSRPGEVGFLMNAANGSRLQSRPGRNTMTRQMMLGDLCRRLVTENYAPAALLIDDRNQCLYSLGPTDRYLRMPPGQPTYDVLSMVRPALRTKLRSAIEQALQDGVPVVLAGGRTVHDGVETAFAIEIRSLVVEDERLMLICFVDKASAPRRSGLSTDVADISRMAELERELEATRAEMRGAIRSLEIASEEQTALNEEALSVNEEFQSTNEELLTSKEELQSVNEELTALNTQLQETLERQRTTSNDLQNILYSTDVATLFLDKKLNIRFFTPATKLLFKVIATDIGRPLADLRSLAIDRTLAGDARDVLLHHLSIEREIEAETGSWFSRRILPYRGIDGGVEGVVITFIDISEKKAAAGALEVAKQQAELANFAKSRFLAAASHDLRQPLQTMALLQGLMESNAKDDQARQLVAQLDETVSAMSGMLNTLLDINQIEAGVVTVAIKDFPIASLMERLRVEFNYHAQAKGLRLRVAPSSLWVHSDPRLLEQMVRNLLTNALKYTSSGSVLLGCRRRAGVVRIEVWDTGIGIRKSELEAIFDEYHQIGNAARERNLGLGLGLSIVQRLGKLLGAAVRVDSHLGKGSVFRTEVARCVAVPDGGTAPSSATPVGEIRAGGRASGTILIVEDDPDIRDLLDRALRSDGYATVLAADGVAALQASAISAAPPEFILADYRLPNGLSGLQVVDSLRERFGHRIPAAVLTGDISSSTLREITERHCELLNKPVKLAELKRLIRLMLAGAQQD